MARTRKHLTRWLAKLGKHEIAEEAQRRGVMIVPINNPEDLMANPQFRHRGFFSKVDHPVLGEALYPTVPYRLSATPASIDTPAPLLGEDSEAVLGSLGEAP